MSTATSTEILPLSRETVAQLLVDRAGIAPSTKGTTRRKVARWPFPGTVELWLPEADGTERYALATSLNLSAEGVGIRCDEPLSPGMELPIAIHEPEISLHGKAVVRHCTDFEGDFLVGIEFVCDRT